MNMNPDSSGFREGFSELKKQKYQIELNPGSHLSEALKYLKHLYHIFPHSTVFKKKIKNSIIKMKTQIEEKGPVL